MLQMMKSAVKTMNSALLESQHSSETFISRAEQHVLGLAVLLNREGHAIVQELAVEVRISSCTSIIFLSASLTRVCGSL
jgi:hypothetical protein